MALEDTDLMPYGKYKGEKMANVPASYLLWCDDQSWCTGEVKKYIQSRYEVLSIEIQRDTLK